MRGKVADVRFVGAMVHYRVDAPGARLHVITSSQGSLLGEGSEVIASWRPEDALILGEGATDLEPSSEVADEPARRP